MSDPVNDAIASAAWNCEGTWGGYLGTPIAPHFFLSAAHIGQAGGSHFIYHGIDYTVVRGDYDPASDLALWETAQSFPTFAPLNTTTDEIGRRAVAVGRGTTRGNAYSLNDAMLGWLWGGNEGTMRWGENIIAEAFTYRANFDLLRAYFDQNGLPNECTYSSGDSGGGLFLDVNGICQLGGINSFVDSGFSENASGAPQFVAALFDLRGLYVQNDSGAWELVTGDNPVPTGFYPTRIATKLAWISSVIARPAIAREGNFATLTYTKLLNAAALSYAVEQSSDLLNWQTASTVDEIISSNSGTAVVKAKIALNGASSIFLRLRTTQP